MPASSFWLSLLTCVVASAAKGLSIAPFRVGTAFSVAANADANSILKHDLMSDGTVKYAGITPSGGEGFQFIQKPDGRFSFPFSTNAVLVDGDFLFTVNPGSNTISMFKIDPYDPSSLKMIGTPVNSGGEFPISVTRSAKSGNLCTLNGGAVNGVQCFTVDPKHGLAPLRNTNRLFGFNQTSPPIGPNLTGSQVLFSKDGDRLFAAWKGINGSTTDLGLIAAWKVSSDGSLSASHEVTPGGGQLFSMTPIPNTDAYLASDPTWGYEVWDFMGKTTAKVMNGFVSGQVDSCWSIFSDRSGTYFLSDRITGTIWEVALDKKLQGTVVGGYVLDTGAQPLDIGIGKFLGKEILYVLAAGHNSLTTFAIGKPGKSEFVQTFNFTTVVNDDGVATVFPHVLGMGTYIIPSFRES